MRPAPKPPASSWRAIQDDVLRRIRDGVWRPGDPIPGEAELAREFGCARATVNRALRQLAEDGLLERRRRAGTRVAPRPVRRARFAIPLIRDGIEASGAAYGYRLLARRTGTPPAPLPPGETALHVRALHLADGAPHALEDRWINPGVAPGALEADFAAVSANEWLVERVPFTDGDATLTSVPADAARAAHLSVAPGAALFVMERATRVGERVVTCVTISFAPGFRMRLEI